MRTAKSNRGGRRSAELTALVLATYGDVCWLRLPGCTRRATTKDHVIPHSHGGDDSLDNLRPACHRCNSKRRDLRISGHGATTHVVMGPPAAGKTTFVAEHATAQDVVIDLDAIARALMPHPPTQTHTYPEHIRHIAIGARKSAIERAARLRENVTVWLIHAIPTPDELYTYRRLRYRVTAIDPGREVVELRARTMRPAVMLPAVDRYYALYAHGIDDIIGTEDTSTPTSAPSELTSAPSRAW